MTCSPGAASAVPTRAIMSWDSTVNSVEIPDLV